MSEESTSAAVPSQTAPDSRKCPQEEAEVSPATLPKQLEDANVTKEDPEQNSAPTRPPTSIAVTGGGGESSLQQSLLSEAEQPSSPPPSYVYSLHSQPPLLAPLAPVAPSVFTEPPPPSPPTYAEAVRTGRLTFVDFAPKCLDDGGILSSPRFERFDLLVARANAWLKLNPTVQAISLETLEYTVDEVVLGKRVDTRPVTQHEVEKNGSIHVQILRMWVIPKDYGDSLEPQQLGYINVVPACLDPGGVSKSPTFDSLSVTLCKLNIMLKQKPLPGDILSAESVAQKFRQYGKWIDADRCHYREHADLSSSRLIIIRVYYQAGSASTAQIGFQDFTPKCQCGENTHSQTLDIESFGRLLHRANKWLRRQNSIAVLNLQSVNYKVKMKSGSDLPESNSNKTLFTSFRTPSVLQTLRLWYTQDTTNSPMLWHRTGSLRHRPPLPQHLACQTFVPYQTDEGGVFGAPEYELLSDVRVRLTEWINQNTELQIMSAESSLIKPPSLTESSGTDSVIPTYFPNSTEGSTWLRVLRVYVSVGSRSQTQQSSIDSEEPSQTLNFKKQCCVLM